MASGTPEPLRSRLTAALGPDRVLTRALDLVAYASDASPYRLIPQAVAVPRDVEDVVALLRCAAEVGAPLVFRAGGTSLNGQAQTDSILVDVRRHWRRVTVESGGARARAESGAVLGQVNRRLAPDDVGGHCCATPWSSKAFAAGRKRMAARTGAALERWSNGGRLPVVIDASSCPLGVLQNVAPAGVEVIDSISWVHDRLLARLEIPRRLGSMLVHPTCAAAQLGVSAKLSRLASRMADEVVIPAGTRCCGMAGDRGWLHPELPQSALGDVTEELGDAGFDACVSRNRTCELALGTVTGRPYASFALTLEELTR